MKIYDFETFEENYINTKTIKFKKFEDVTDPEWHNIYYDFWNKSLTVKFSEKRFGFFYFVDEKDNYNFRLSKQKFEDIIEYIETNSELEIE